MFYVFGRDIRIYQKHVGGVHIEFPLQFFIRYNTLQVFWQRFIQIVIYFCVSITIQRRNEYDGKENGKNHEMPRYKFANLIHIGDQSPVPRFFQRLIQHQNKRRQDSYTSRHAEHNSLCHYQAKIHTKHKTHKA